ncbi:hypothetical protein NWF32_27375 [Pseudomonas qingdaonensis]|nr:hypothetical protein [Pseudomonas qingdaonensis]
MTRDKALKPDLSSNRRWQRGCLLPGGPVGSAWRESIERLRVYLLGQLPA